MCCLCVGHYPNSATPDSCQHVEKPIWASEDFSSDFQAGGCWSRLLNRNYALSNMTATIAWNLVAAYYDGQTDRASLCVTIPLLPFASTTPHTELRRLCLSQSCPGEAAV
jgi:hypothetical protein